MFSYVWRMHLSTDKTQIQLHIFTWELIKMWWFCEVHLGSMKFEIETFKDISGLHKIVMISFAWLLTLSIAQNGNETMSREQAQNNIRVNYILKKKCGKMRQIECFELKSIKSIGFCVHLQIFTIEIWKKKHPKNFLRNSSNICKCSQITTHDWKNEWFFAMKNWIYSLISKPNCAIFIKNMKFSMNK